MGCGLADPFREDPLFPEGVVVYMTAGACRPLGLRGARLVLGLLGTALGSSCPGGGVSAAPVAITLNANGINDPVRLARMIEPELARLGRLAR